MRIEISCYIYTTVIISVLYQEAKVNFRTTDEKYVWRKIFMVPFYQVLGELFIEDAYENSRFRFKILKITVFVTVF